jgi:catechol 2,3-dioxygenase-like lactoylglutathione lyase family enzyme
MAPAIRFHLSLNVSDLRRSVEFYRLLFGREPAKLRPDYAKFELDDPPLVLSLEPTARPTGGPLNHLGFRLPDSAILVAMQERLERTGIRSQREEGVECCYARQTKFWVRDPDHTLWEVYTLDEDIEHRGAGQDLEAMLPADGGNGLAEPVVWEHVLYQPVPKAIPLADNVADEVRLTGTFNVPPPVEGRDPLLAEARRVLRPGGRVFVHVLVGDQPFQGPPGLPGPAAAVQHVPLQSEPMAWLARSGFQGMRMIKFDAQPCFVRQGVAMRELQLEGWKERGPGDGLVSVLYKGPFGQVTDDSGTVFPRGTWVRVRADLAERLRTGVPEEFVVCG